MAISPGPPRPGRSAALDPTEGVKGWAVDCATLCSQLVGLGEGATGAGRKADKEVYLRVRELVARDSPYRTRD
ncbi:MAG: hypothetical protein LVS60_13715 [Nodosilinea sp. LVE1205-7]|jgi:hypothetical protein